jgi:hypothetical protein
MHAQHTAQLGWTANVTGADAQRGRIAGPVQNTTHHYALSPYAYVMCDCCGYKAHLRQQACWVAHTHELDFRCCCCQALYKVVNCYVGCCCCKHATAACHFLQDHFHNSSGFACTYRDDSR